MLDICTITITRNIFLYVWFEGGEVGWKNMRISLPKSLIQ